MVPLKEWEKLKGKNGSLYKKVSECKDSSSELPSVSTSLFPDGSESAENETSRSV